MSPPEPFPAVSFAEDLDPDDRVSGPVPTARPGGAVAAQRRGAAVAGLVFVLIAWLGASPLVDAVTAVLPQGMHRIGQLTEQSIEYGSTDYYGVTPGLLPVVTYGTRALLLLIALALAFRARSREHSAVATAALATASISLLLVTAAGVVLAIGLALGHGGGGYTYPF